LEMREVLRRSGFLSGVHLLAVMGCGPGDQAYQVTEIAESLREALGANATTWGTCDALSLEVGHRDVELSGVSGVALTARKELVVANGSSGELLLFDREGGLVRRAGGRGAGPGEFVTMSLIPDWSSDSLLVFDLTQQRLSVMDPEGRFVRTVQLRREDGARLDRRVEVHGRLEDGRFVVRGHEPRPSEAMGLVRAGARVALHLADGRFHSLLGEFEGDEVLFAEYSGMRITSRLPFLGTLLVAAGTNHVFVYEGPELEVVSAAPYALFPREFSADARVREITWEQYSGWVEAELGRFPPSAAIEETRRYYEAIFEPWALQVVDRMFVDQAGRVWLGSERFREEPHWILLDGRFRGLAVVDLPPGFRPMQATEAEVVGLRRDSLGVESVEVRCLTDSAE